jgi:hypothetical protein
LVAYAFKDGEGFLVGFQGLCIPPLVSVNVADVAIAGSYSLLVAYAFTDGEGFLIRF